MEIKLVKGLSKKSGKEYYAIELKVCDDYTKIVFLSREEVALIKGYHGNVFVER